MALDVTGKIILLLPETSGQSKAGKPWVKQEFVLETQEQYPRKICIGLMGDKVQELKKYGVGMEVKVSLNIESREYNGKWYTNVNGWKIEALGNAPSYSNQAPETTFHADPEPQFTPDSTTDDLPF
ncbi:MAG: DUF3127 domain-containing protein [Bacteroidetes bacterium]|nr:DUF3127 domain-containing protein [Bacteroidota bacterium]MCK6609560.1 DUF3127 domain-containing protein [Bacteroidia bacterium]